ELGIYDMSGNLWEWCWDGYSYDRYSTRRLRGGSWAYDASSCTVAFRYFGDPSFRDYHGFRLARGSGQ
ncbi:MAG: hypothetical protein EBS96_13785, partial [Spartobacteria bacterium]|nr:hypothetical protein [Spartobacteria bacterium]